MVGIDGCRGGWVGVVLGDEVAAVAGPTVAAILGEAGPVEQLIEVVGALFILAAFVLAQVGRLATTSLAYLALNLVGSGILAVVAAVDGDTGFLLLEGVWAVVSAFSLTRLVLRGRPGQP